MDVHPESLLTRLQTIPDPRRREGRRYPFPALLGMLLLGVLHGHDSLRGAWMWASHHWPPVWRPLGAHGPHFPSYQIVHGLLRRLDADAVDRSVRPWAEPLLGHPVGEVSADGTRLRASNRDAVPGRHLLSVVSHDLGGVLAQQEAVHGDEVTALFALLTAVPLRERILTLDAGMRNAQVTHDIRAPDGDYRGLGKGNQAEINAVLDDWIAAAVCFLTARRPVRWHPAGAGAGCPETAARCSISGTTAARTACPGCRHLEQRPWTPGISGALGGARRRPAAVSGG